MKADGKKPRVRSLRSDHQSAYQESGSYDLTTYLKAGEHHRFSLGEQWYLFGINSLIVLPSSDLDHEIFKVAGNGCRYADILNGVSSTPGSRSQVIKRLNTLIANKFLLAPNDSERWAETRPSTNYATFMVNVTQRCNLTCSYCYVNKGEFDYPEKPVARMATDTADSLVDKIYGLFPDFKTYCYHFYGGEPLMNFDTIQRIVATADRKARQTRTTTEYHITTNGTLLDARVADFMDAHRFTVYFSIDGDQRTHDELRKYINGKGSFRTVRKHLQYLRSKKRVHLIGSSVIRKGFSLESALKHLEQYGAQQCKAERVRLHDMEDLALQGKEHDDYLRDIRGLVDHYIGNLSRYRKPMDFRLSSKILQLLTKVRRTFFCPAGERMFGISADGELYPCALHVGRPQSKMGDLNTGLDTIKQEAFRARFGWEGQEECRGCWNRHLCGGGCSAMVDRFGHEDCDALRMESEAAIAIYQHFSEKDPSKLFGLISPKLVQWIDGKLPKPPSRSEPENAPVSEGEEWQDHGQTLYQIQRRPPASINS